MIRRLAFALVLLAGCSAAIPFAKAPHSLGTSGATVTADRTLPPNLLYTLGGKPQSRAPYIQVFDAQAAGPTPSPLYTIRPEGNTGFGLLAVDAQNDLFAEKFFYNGDGKLYQFPPGSTVPSTTCLLHPHAGTIALANGKLYLSRGGASIAEYAEPLPKGDVCPKPVRTLVDERAKRFGNGILGLVADPQGDVFDVWSSPSTYAGSIDEFSSGSTHAHLFANLGKSSGTFYLVSDRNGALLTSIDGYKGSLNDSIAVFPHGSGVPKLFYPSGPGAYGGVGLASHEREFFALNSYPIATVHIYEYDPKTATLGTEAKRSFSNVWGPGQSIAVFSK